MKRVKEFPKKLWALITNPMIGVLPGQIAFFLVLSIFPILILLGVVASFFSISMDTIIEGINTTFPKDIVNMLVPLLSGKEFDSNIAFSMVIGFVLASNGAHSIVIASNALYGFENADVVRRRVKSIFIIMLMIGLFVFTLLVLAFGDVIIQQVIRFSNDDSVAVSLYRFFILFRWPIAMFIMFFNIKLIYILAPDWKIYSRHTTKGALFTTFGWIITTAIYSYYAIHFANYNFFYGGLSSIVVLMVWIYALSYILVIGIAINVNEYKKVNNKE